jgi:hypothetical protein
MYSMTQNFLYFFADEYKKYADFFSTLFKSVEIMGKKCTQENFMPKTFAGY